MARQARLDTPGALHHIMVRGVNRTSIFLDDEERQRFLSRLGREILEGKCSIYAWVLMDNHVHLLFKSGQFGVSKVMRRLLTWFAQYFNRRHSRSGHLFENRYKSILCDEEHYLLALVRYIHLNPLRSKMVSTLVELDHYPWSGHSVLMGHKDCTWMEKEYVLARFGANEGVARREYRRFLEEAIAIEQTGGMGLGHWFGRSAGWSQVVGLQRRDETEARDQRILGGGDFVEAILREVEERQLRELKVRRKGPTVTDIITEECARLGISPKEVTKGSRRRLVSEVRALIAYRSSEELGLSAAAIARHVGVTTSSVTRAIERLQNQEKSQNMQRTQQRPPSHETSKDLQ